MTTNPSGDGPGDEPAAAETDTSSPLPQTPPEVQNALRPNQAPAVRAIPGRVDIARDLLRRQAMAGPDAARAAWPTAPHNNDVAFQKLAPTAPTDAPGHGQTAPAHRAHPYGRYCAPAGIPKPYGTRFRYTPTGIKPYPIADREVLDERRTQYGLTPCPHKAEAPRRRHTGEAA